MENSSLATEGSTSVTTSQSSKPRVLDAGGVYRVIAGGASLLRGFGSKEDAMWARLLDQIADDVASAPQNLVRGFETPGELIGWSIGILKETSANDTSVLVREEMWETAFGIAQFLEWNDPTLIENRGAKFCRHCSYRCEIYNSSGVFGTTHFFHTQTGPEDDTPNCWDLVFIQRRPLGELIPPHRKWMFK